MSIPMKGSYYFELDDEEYQVKVIFDYRPGQPAKLSYWPAEPSEPDEVNDLCTECSIVIPTSEMDKIYDWAYEYGAEHCHDYDAPDAPEEY